MAMSGVTVADECKKVFSECKDKHALRYIIFQIKDEKQVIVAEKGEKGKKYDDFLKALPKDKPCYAVADVEYTAKAGGTHAKIVFFFWSPDTSKPKDKMLYASSKDGLKKALAGVQVEKQANDLSDISLKEMQTMLEKL